MKTCFSKFYIYFLIYLWFINECVCAHVPGEARRWEKIKSSGAGVKNRVSFFVIGTESQLLPSPRATSILSHWVISTILSKLLLMFMFTLWQVCTLCKVFYHYHPCLPLPTVGRLLGNPHFLHFIPTLFTSSSGWVCLELLLSFYLLVSLLVKKYIF